MLSSLFPITAKTMRSWFLAHFLAHPLLCKVNTLQSDKYISLLPLLLQRQQNIPCTNTVPFLSTLFVSSEFSERPQFLDSTVLIGFARVAAPMNGLFCRFLAPRGIRGRRVKLSLKIVLKLTIQHCTTTSYGSLLFFIGVQVLNLKCLI